MMRNKGIARVYIDNQISVQHNTFIDSPCVTVQSIPPAKMYSGYKYTYLVGHMT